MRVDYEGYEFVIDPEIDFIMLYNCYMNGCNCFNCLEREVDGCVIDEVEIEDVWPATRA